MLVSVLAVVLICPVIGVTTAFASGASGLPTPGPYDDSFYVPPNPLPAGPPGQVIRWRPSVAGAPEDSVNAWQVMYLSTNALGQPDAVTGTILEPKGVDPATEPIVSFAPGTQGPAFRCAPSKMLQIGAFYEQPGVDDLLNSGYAVVVTDYEGYQPTPKTTYIVGQSEGHAVIDMVRAAQALPEAGLSVGAKVVFRGYSQGGGAVMWAGQMQPTYAPTMNLVGVAGGGVPADLTQVALGLDGHFGAGLLFYALIGLDNAYPDLHLSDYLTPAGKTEFATIEGQDCTLQLLLNYQDKSFLDYSTSSPFLTQDWLNRVAENKLGATPIKVPVFDYGATNDNLVDPTQQATLRTEYCKEGVTVFWQTYDTDHITLVYTGNADVLRFVRDRFAGTPATSNC